jgi:hypothetical protein
LQKLKEKTNDAIDYVAETLQNFKEDVRTPEQQRISQEEKEQKLRDAGIEPGQTIDPMFEKCIVNPQ